MGPLPTMPKKSMPFMKPMATPVLRNSPAPTKPGGMLTSGKIRTAISRLHRTGKSGDRLADTLNQAADKHGGVLNERQFREVIDGLKRDHNVGPSGIKRLEDAAI